jgi:hypothetical protein
MKAIARLMVCNVWFFSVGLGKYSEDGRFWVEISAYIFGILRVST